MLIEQGEEEAEVGVRNNGSQEGGEGSRRRERREGERFEMSL